MNEHLEPDPLDALRAANPVNADRLSPASLARIRARVIEDVMTTDTQTRWGGWRPRLLRLGAGTAAIGALALLLVFGRFGSTPSVVPGGTSGTGAASCVEPYSQLALRNRDFAFDGTVTAIDGEKVTFSIKSVFRGAHSATVTLDANGMTGGITSAGGPKLTVGSRYLVAGDAQFVWGCGYTQPYDAGVAAEWSAALGG
jgi:hypothetical protein